MPLYIIIASAITQVLVLHGIGRIFMRDAADTYWGLATFVGFASFITFHQRDGLPTWPALPLLVGLSLLTYYLSIKVHRRLQDKSPT